MIEPERIRSAEVNLERQLEWISRYDNKASVVLGVNTAMLGLLATLAPPAAALGVWTVTPAVLAGGLLVGSLVLVYLGNYPQTRGSNAGSLLFFGTIAGRETDDYAGAWRATSPGDYLTDLLGQTHRNAQILATKFRHLRWAYRLMFASVLPWLVAIYAFQSVGG